MEADDNKARVNLLKLAQCLQQDDMDCKQLDFETTDVNFQVPDKDYAKEYAGYTLLHLAAKNSNKNLVDRLLELETDLTIQGYHDGFTPLRCTIDESKLTSGWRITDISEENPISTALLSAQVNSGSTLNPVCKYGISHLHLACMMDHAEAVEFFLLNATPVDQTVNNDSKIVPGYTPLHFAVRYCSLKAVEILLKYGANIHKMDARGLSALHFLIKYRMELKTLMSFLIVNEKFLELSTNMKLLETMANIFLRTMEKEKNNFIDEQGVSAFHLACTLSETTSVEKYLSLDDGIDTLVSDDSPFWPCYTALHFAAHFNPRTFQLLLQAGADIFFVDAMGKSPLDLLIENHNVEKVHSILADEDDFERIFLSKKAIKLLDLLLSAKNPEEFGTFMKENIYCSNTQVSSNSLLWPGYTSLHLAVELTQRLSKLNSIKKEINLPAEVQKYIIDESIEKLCSDRINVCLNNYRDVYVRDANGCTPIHLAFELLQGDVVNLFLSEVSKNSVNFGGLSHLHIACALNNISAVKRLIKKSTAVLDIRTENRFIWYKDFANGDFSLVTLNAGSTPLHFAAIFGDENMMNCLLEQQVDILAKDENSLTPLHLSMSQKYPSVARKLLFQYSRILIKDDGRILKDCITNEGLSYLHVAAFANCEITAENLIDRTAIDLTLKIEKEDTKDDLNFPVSVFSYFKRFSNSTPLHIAIEMNSEEVIELLIRKGADIYSKNEHGQTPLYYAMKNYFDTSIVDTIIERFQLDVKRKICARDDDGVTLLHFACSRFDFELMKSLLSMGFDPNAQICKFEEDKWNGGETPIHLLLQNTRVIYNRFKRCSFDDESPPKFSTWINLLLNHGADVTVMGRNRTPLLYACYFAMRYYPIEREYFEFNMRSEARRFDDERPAEYFREDTDDFCNFSSDDNDKIDDYYRNAPDVSDVDWDSDETPYYYGTYITSALSLMLRSQKSYAINPVGLDDGWSHFHCACMRNEAAVVLKFLENGIDVNLITNPFAKVYGGYTPLHFAITYHCKDVVEILLKHGADVKAEDNRGNTPLHVAAFRNFSYENMLKLLLLSGANMNARNLSGQTPVELLLTSRFLTAKKLKFYLDYGCNINFFESPENNFGLLGIALWRQYELRTFIPILETIIEAGKVISNNFNAIQSIVAVHEKMRLSVKDYLQVIQRLINAGCELDQRSEKGTALCIAIRLKNIEGMTALLTLGADIDMVDKEVFQGSTLQVLTIPGNNLPTIVAGPSDELTLEINRRIAFHIWKIIFVGMDVKQQMLEIFKNRLSARFSAMRQNCEEEFKNMGDAKITKSITVRNFLSCPNVFAEYRKLPTTQRKDIDQYFKSLKTVYESFPELMNVLMLQYKRIQRRMKLWNPAILALEDILPLPNLCLEIILKHFVNSELIYLVETVEGEVGVDKLLSFI